MLNAGQRKADPVGFFGDGSCVHAKNAIALLGLHAITGDVRFRDAAAMSCDDTLTLQDPGGAFWSTPRKEEVHTHAHCYLCEGLLFVSSVLRDSRYQTAARRGIDRLAAAQQ